MLTSSRLFLGGVIIASLVAGAISGAAAGLLAPRYFPSLTNGSSVVQTNSPSSNQNGDQGTIDLVKRASPAVVSINVSKVVQQAANSTPDFFQQFFGNDPFFQFQAPQQNTPQNNAQPKQGQPQKVGAGSGFLVSADGWIVTNKHVVDDASATFTVVTQDGKEYPVKSVAKDPSLDLAIIKIDGKDFPYLALGDSGKVEVGQTVIAIGNALAQFQNSVTKGVVSGINRRITAGSDAGSEVIEGAIQTDAAINPGNSGGPLLNLHGEVVGVNTAMSQNGQSLGFALPVNAVNSALQSARTLGRIVRPWLGIRYVMIDDALAKANKLSVKEGALITRNSPQDPGVVPDSPADKAGLKSEDIITEIDGQKLDQNHSLSLIISSHGVGDTVSLKILRDGKEQTVKVKLEERKA